jgi:hypothetical protein|tara:strand:+ start:176 stop:403 length:228 start_codon:yes stop_codon:yes gene_type:complete
MAKKKPKLNPIQEIDAKLQTLMDKRLKAHSGGASGDIMMQIDRMIQELQLELYNETELQRHRESKDNEDGEQWIV